MSLGELVAGLLDEIEKQEGEVGITCVVAEVRSEDTTTILVRSSDTREWLVAAFLEEAADIMRDDEAERTLE